MDWVCGRAICYLCWQPPRPDSHEQQSIVPPPYLTTPSRHIGISRYPGYQIASVQWASSSATGRKMGNDKEKEKKRKSKRKVNEKEKDQKQHLYPKSIMQECRVMKKSWKLDSRSQDERPYCYGYVSAAHITTSCWKTYSGNTLITLLPSRL